MADNNKNRNNGGGRPIALPAGYLQGGYYKDEKKHILKKEYIVDYSKEIAEMLESDGGRDANRRSQIRKFYEYVLRVERKLGLSGNDYAAVEADLLELLPHVTYAASRRVVSNIFIKFIEKNVTAVHDDKDLKAFVKHFEAVIAFTKKD